MTGIGSALDIPIDVWEHVISILDHDLHLQNLSLVSKYLLSITNRYKLSLNIFNSTAPFLPSLLRRFPNLNHLSFASFSGDAVPLLHQIAEFQFPLQTLDLSNQERLPIEALQRFPASVLSGVRSFKIRSLAKEVDDADLEMIADFFSNLEELDLSRINDGDDNVLSGSRHRFYGHSCHPEDRKKATDDGISVLASRLKSSLKRINLKGNDWVSDEAVLSLSKNCPNLEEIVLKCCEKVTPNGIAIALNGCKNLKTTGLHRMKLAPGLICTPLSCALNLSQVVFSDSVVSDALLNVIANAKLPLKSFSLINCSSRYSEEVFTFAGLLSLLKTYDSLHHSALVGVDFLSNASVGTLVNSLTLVRSVKLRQSGNRYGSGGVSDLTLVTLIQQCPLLETLEITHTANIEDASGLCGVTNAEIRTLDLSFNDNLSDECLEKIALACPNLERLQLRRSPEISKKGIGQILRNYLSLKHLKMDECLGVKNLGLKDWNTGHKQQLELRFLGAPKTGLNDKALIDIAGRCPHLMFLNLDSCEGLTTKGVKQVVDKCTRLKEINLHRCEHVSTSILPWMVFCKQSLRKILPPDYLRGNEENLYLRHGCGIVRT